MYKVTIITMKRILTVVLCAAIFCGTASGWGRQGHSTIAKIAENNLKPSAKKKIEKYLGGHSIVYYSAWMDDYRETKEYGFTTTWHTAPVNEDLHYADSLLNPKKGNAIFGLEQAIEILKDYKNQPDSTVAVNLKYVIHLVGDMHCPSHVKYKGRKMRYFIYMPKSPTQISAHAFWDSGSILFSRFYSFSEWAEELDILDKKTVKEITSGTPRDWFHDCAVRCLLQFDITAPDMHLTKDSTNPAIELCETQIQYAGYRLAAVLNELF